MAYPQPNVGIYTNTDYAAQHRPGARKDQDNPYLVPSSSWSKNEADRKPSRVSLSAGPNLVENDDYNNFRKASSISRRRPSWEDIVESNAELAKGSPSLVHKVSTVSAAPSNFSNRPHRPNSYASNTPSNYPMPPDMSRGVGAVDDSLNVSTMSSVTIPLPTREIDPGSASMGNRRQSYSTMVASQQDISCDAETEVAGGGNSDDGVPLSNYGDDNVARKTGYFGGSRERLYSPADSAHPVGRMGGQKDSLIHHAPVEIRDGSVGGPGSNPGRINGSGYVGDNYEKTEFLLPESTKFKDQNGTHSQRNEPSGPSKGVLCKVPPRKCLIWSVVAVGTLLFAAILAVIIKKFAFSPSVYRFDLYEVDQPAEMTAVVSNERIAVVITGIDDLSHTISRGWFEQKYMSFMDHDCPLYCFFMELNTTAFPNYHDTLNATQNALDVRHNGRVKTTWNWGANLANEPRRSELIELEPECRKKRIIWVQDVYFENRHQCENCPKICLPRFGTQLMDTGNRWRAPLRYFAFLSKMCFYLDIPEINYFEFKNSQ